MMNPIIFVIILILGNLFGLIGMIIAYVIIQDLIHSNDTLTDLIEKQDKTIRKYLELLENETSVSKAINVTNCKILDLCIREQNNTDETKSE